MLLTSKVHLLLLIAIVVGIGIAMLHSTSEGGHLLLVVVSLDVIVVALHLFLPTPVVSILRLVSDPLEGWIKSWVLLDESLIDLETKVIVIL